MTVGLVAALALLLVAGLSFVELAVGVRRLRRLADVPPHAGAGAPRVSVIVAARNEARGIEAGLSSLLEQTWSDYEIVVIDDRSTDATPEIVARLAARDPRIVSVRVDELPRGWLGKNHALWTGARRARGEWLLFTDADVVMRPDTVSRAVSHATTHGRDHVTLTPRLVMPSALLEAFVVVFTALFCLWTKPWRAPNPRSRHFVGVGAFNLVRRAAYERAGTHERIALRPDDDLKLAKILKESGASQELLEAPDFLSVAWYHSLGELVRGLEKNAFAGLDYRPGVAVAGALTQLALAFGPLVGAVVGSGATRWASVATVGITLVGFIAASRAPRMPPSRALLYPAVVGLFAFIVLRTLVVNLRDGGIRWRDTFYPLDLLKSNRV